MQCVPPQGTLWPCQGLSAEFQAQLLRGTARHADGAGEGCGCLGAMFLGRAAAAAPASCCVRMWHRWSHGESSWHSLGEGEVPLLVSSAPLETQTLGPASPQLQLEEVGVQQHPRTKPISYWNSLLSVSLVPDVISELCLSQMALKCIANCSCPCFRLRFSLTTTH